MPYHNVVRIAPCVSTVQLFLCLSPPPQEWKARCWCKAVGPGIREPVLKETGSAQACVQGQIPAGLSHQGQANSSERLQRFLKISQVLLWQLQKGAPQIDSRDPKVQPKVIQPHKVSQSLWNWKEAKKPLFKVT